MYSTRNSKTHNDYYLPFSQPATARGLASSKFASSSLLLDAPTKDQQTRIGKLINTVKKKDIFNPNAMTISQSELSRIKSSTSFMTKDDLIQKKRILEEQLEAQQAVNKARIKKMLEIEAEKKKQMPLSDIEIEKAMKDEAIRARAKALLNEEKDDVKQMNQMMLYAQVVSVRDSQLSEKTTIRQQNKKEERLKDLYMELDRLKKIKYYEQLEERKKEEQRMAADETIKQIKERELERKKRQEQIEKEGQDMLRQIKENQYEDSKTSLLKKQQQKELLDQIFLANQNAIKGKQDRIQQELEEEEKIIQYNIEKARKEAEYAAEQKRIKDQKEKEVQKLRELQQKASDRQSEIDALRAKRAMEHADRLARHKEQKEAELRAKVNQELLEQRHHQHLEKQYRLQEQARAEKEEFQRIVENQKYDREIEQRIEKEKMARTSQHADQLKKQIAINEEKKKLVRREFLEEGRLIRDRLKNEKRLIEDIKQDKLEQMATNGIPNKYTAELAKKKILF